MDCSDPYLPVLDRCTIRKLIKSVSHSDIVLNAVVTLIDVEIFLLSTGVGMQKE